mmetsp:Transcript_6211/g.8485  ORF Transcript_6211/g.8485 Transcript_6211/m.8485 type:complete len:132 (-) Transcript_6211:291-686(-)
MQIGILVASILLFMLKICDSFHYCGQPRRSSSINCDSNNVLKQYERLQLQAKKRIPEYVFKNSKLDQNEEMKEVEWDQNVSSQKNENSNQAAKTELGASDDKFVPIMVGVATVGYFGLIGWEYVRLAFFSD